MAIAAEAGKAESQEDGTVVWGLGEGLERRLRPAGDGVVIEVWERTAVIRLSADEVSLLYAVAERPRDR